MNHEKELTHTGTDTAEVVRLAAPPTRPLLLFRGCPHDRRFGMSWTPINGVANSYARQNGADEAQCGNIYRHWAAPREILGRIRDTSLAQPHEVILDPAYLTDDTVGMLDGVAPAEYSAAYTARHVLDRDPAYTGREDPGTPPNRDPGTPRTRGHFPGRTHHPPGRRATRKPATLRGNLAPTGKPSP
jgi:hypothetical protein